MRLPSGAGFSVRTITSAGLAALALLCLTVAVGVGWIAALLQSTSSALVRDAESLRLVTQIELQLLDFQRLAVFADDPIARAERRNVRRALRASLQEAVGYAADGDEAALLEQTAADIEAYLQRRAELEQSGIGALEVQRLARPALGSALTDLELLSDMNRDEVTRGYARAQGVGSFFMAAAAGTVLLTLGLLLVMTVAIRRMLLRPILGLREAIDRFRAGDSAANADERAPRELSDIARTFNEMSIELGRQKARQLAFIAGVAHDLRNPLAALKYGVDAMVEQQRPDGDAQTRQTVLVLARQLDHLARMVDDLLETCSIEAGELVLETEVFDLQDAVEAVVELYRPLLDSRPVDLRLAEAPALVQGDRVRIEQVVGNLLSNAIKYSDASSRISVEVTHDGGGIELSVRDHGIGIAADHMEDIFRPFWRGGGSTQAGTGLGLSVVRKIVLAHGGTIGVDSASGSGSVFRVRLPAARLAALHKVS